MFETTGILNEYVLNEVKRYVVPPKQKMMILVMGAVLIAAGLVSYLVWENSITACISFAIGLSLLFQINKMADKAIKMNIRNIRANCGENACTYTTSFSDEGILVHNLATGAKVRYKYEGIVSVKESANLLVLFTKSHQMITVFKHDLDESVQELKDYLKTMPTQIKW